MNASLMVAQHLFDLALQFISHAHKISFKRSLNCAFYHNSDIDSLSVNLFNAKVHYECSELLPGNVLHDLHHLPTNFK
jgi:hypothetical protein